jgi:hypothetical protein
MPCRDVQNGVGMSRQENARVGQGLQMFNKHLICFELMTEIQKEGDNNGREDGPPRKQHASFTLPFN